MKTKTAAALFIAAVFAPASALAGVVFQVETTYHSGSPGVESSEMSVEKPNLKMEIASGSGNASGSVRDVAIYNGDRRQMVVVDHRDKSYMVVDAAAVKQMGGAVNDQMNQAMKEMEAHLKGLDPKQRELVDEMLKGRSGGVGISSAPMQQPKSEFRRTSERATKQGYPCVRYDVMRDGEKMRELWVTDWNNVEGGADVSESFSDIADFWEEILNSASDATGAVPFETDRHSIDIFSKIDGFPVVTREFEGGELESETVLKSVTERDLDPDAFEPPKGYRLRTMGPQ